MHTLDSLRNECIAAFQRKQKTITVIFHELWLFAENTGYDHDGGEDEDDEVSNEKVRLVGLSVWANLLKHDEANRQIHLEFNVKELYKDLVKSNNVIKLKPKGKE